jgi:hypothetical protein
MGGQPYKELTNILFEGCVLEIGGERGEGSTRFLCALAEDRNRSFISIDIDPLITKASQDIVSGCDFALCVNDSGERYLENWPHEPIGIAYLDNFDCTAKKVESGELPLPSHIIKQRQRYSELGLEMNNENCEEAHLKQSQGIHKNKSNLSFIVFDDTYPEAGYSGKGCKAVPWLLGRGWKMHSNGLVWVILKWTNSG